MSGSKYRGLRGGKMTGGPHGLPPGKIGSATSHDIVMAEEDELSVGPTSASTLEIKAAAKAETASIVGSALQVGSPRGYNITNADDEGPTSGPVAGSALEIKGSAVTARPTIPAGIGSPKSYDIAMADDRDEQGVPAPGSALNIRKPTIT